MSVLILGGSSRLGQALAHAYAKAGHPVYIAGRDLDECAAVASDVAVRGGVETAHGPFDALAFDTHRAFVERVEAAVGPIDVAVVAFGDMGEQADSEADFDKALRVLQVNYTGAISICEALSRTMVARGTGSIVGIASVAGERGRASNYFYGSAKGGFALYLGGLRNRLHEKGVTVLTVKLGFVDTRMTWGLESGIPKASPEAAAAAIVRAQSKGRESIFYPPFWRPIMGVIRAIPERVFKRLSL
ncbi:MAG: decaprenylphospho-beta-D-erythro-pentofuranosid-2-ulose 2-reductase [Myxococcota bacterium]|jgi:decaprenylphospho-beta-D-erythro-pentofuranosid-2-ulose 2-reductase